MILGAIIIGALIYFIYIPYKAWRLSKNPEWIENQKNIKDLEAEYEEAKLEFERNWTEEDEENSKKLSELGKQSFYDYVDKRYRKAFDEPKFIESHNSIKFKGLNASKSDYYNKNIELCGYISISNYYNYGYDNADDTHYSFRLTENHNDMVQVYFKKGISKNLFDKLLETNELIVKIEAIPDKTKNKNNHDDILLEGIKYEILSL